MVPLNPQRGLIRCKLISNETVTPRIGSGRSQGFTDFPFIHREGWKEREGRDARESETKWRARNSVKREGERQREGEPGSSIDRLLSSSVPATEPVGSSCSWNLLLPFSYVRLPLSLSLSLSLFSLSFSWPLYVVPVLVTRLFSRSPPGHGELLTFRTAPVPAKSPDVLRCLLMPAWLPTMFDPIPKQEGMGCRKRGWKKKEEEKKERTRWTND